LYIGITNDLIRRIYEHKSKLVPGFSSKYNLSRLVYYEIHGDIEECILREKGIKKWNRDWKIELIEKMNPGWKDLYGSLL